MTVAEMLRFVAGFYAVWNGELERHLLTRFQLDPQKTLKQLSRGMKAKVALMLALCHDPDVLILDECTSGLDVVVRREFLETVIDLVQCEGKTTLFSTHLVDEVERIADWVGLMDEGRLVFQMPMERLKDWVKHVRLFYVVGPPSRSTGQRHPARAAQWAGNPADDGGLQRRKVERPARSDAQADGCDGLASGGYFCGVCEDVRRGAWCVNYGIRTTEHEGR
jgi:ABC-type multidrug transport system ATPase subunit